MKRQNSFDVSNPAGSRRIRSNRWESGRIRIAIPSYADAGPKAYWVEVKEKFQKLSNKAIKCSITFANTKVVETNSYRLMSILITNIAISLTQHQTMRLYLSSFEPYLYLQKAMFLCVRVRCPDVSSVLTAMKYGTQVVVMVTQCTSKPEF
ncbi:hypothetical protein AVEN_190413-1 [Araneus ventricosus]|uniref:Uncharacterized protein n=1 Tax=Araneus ventricosus TaxID=182803 RepID=A0A4Y2LC77_ARAVE|nr:hypothetical protein AVEN_190413-1 [Araneus ventricosus]